MLEVKATNNENVAPIVNEVALPDPDFDDGNDTLTEAQSNNDLDSALEDGASDWVPIFF